MSDPANPQRDDRPRRHTFRRRHRLSGRRAFAAVFDARVRKHAGPLTVFAKPNGLDHPRLGLTVPRRVGKAVVRNRIKRLLREAYRLSQHELPGGYDIVVTVRPHAPASLDKYERMLTEAMRWVDGEWRRRGDAV
jgi:ribonuclease P protein component